MTTQQCCQSSCGVAGIVFRSSFHSVSFEFIIEYIFKLIIKVFDHSHIWISPARLSNGARRDWEGV